MTGKGIGLARIAMAGASVAMAVVLISAAATKAGVVVNTAAPTHGKVAKGRVIAFDAKAHTLQVRSATATVALVMTPATKITGGVLKTGEFVDVRYMTKAGKNTATSISIAPPVTSSAEKH